MTEKARDLDPRSPVPLRVHPGFKKFPITVELIEDVILSTTGLRATYIFSNFDGIFLTRRIPTSAVMINKRTRRLAVLVNPDFVKRVVIARATERRHRSDRSLPRSQDFMAYDTSLEDEDNAIRAIEQAIREIIKHEFSHIWFHHLQRDSNQPHFLLNVVHDALLNYHVKVDLGLTKSLPWKSKDLLVNAITFTRWVRRAIGRYGNEDELLGLLADGYNEEMSDADYEAFRCFKALREYAKPGLRTPTLCKRIVEFADAVANYSENVDTLIERLCTTFPDLEEFRECSLHPLPRVYRTAPDDEWGGRGWDDEDEDEGEEPLDDEDEDDFEEEEPLPFPKSSFTADGDDEDEGDDEDQEDEDDTSAVSADRTDPLAQDLPGSDREEDPDLVSLWQYEDHDDGREAVDYAEPRGKRGNKPEDFGEPKAVYQIDPSRDSITLDGQEYGPVDYGGTSGHIPPDFDRHVDEIIRGCGAGKAFTKAIMSEVESKKLSKETIKAVLRTATKSLLRVAREALDLTPMPNPVATTLVPNQFPVYSDLVLAQSLMLDREPRYKMVALREDEIKRKKVCLFLDVSGSMQGVWAEVLEFCLALSKECDLDIYQFSTNVVELTLDDIRKGEIYSWGGTSASPIVEKIVELSRVCDSFAVFGDREYSGADTVPRVAQPIRLLDIGFDLRKRAGKPWFRATRRCAVHYVDLNRDFSVALEGSKCSKMSLNERRRALRKTVFGRS